MYNAADAIEDHILRPNAFSVQDVVEQVSKTHGASNSFGCTDAMCCMVCGLFGVLPWCCGRSFRTGVGEISVWLDSNKRPLALQPNTWQLRPNWMEEPLGEYDMSSQTPFISRGLCICKIEAGSVYFAHQGGQPVMIAAKERPGWFVSTDPGFSFAKEIFVDGVKQYDCRARLSASYITFESLHLFNVQPNTVHVVSNSTAGSGNQWQVLPPGAHSFSSPFMRSTAVIATGIQDVTIEEKCVSTQDGIQLTDVQAVLSYQIRAENVPKLLSFDVANYTNIIKDWAKQILLHSIISMEYQHHASVIPGEPDPADRTKGGTILGGRDRARGTAAAAAAARGGTLADVGDSGSAPSGFSSDNVNPASAFRSSLEHHMKADLEERLAQYGVDIKTFALQSFDPPASLAAQLTNALARRTEARYQYEAQQIANLTLLGQAETEATAIRTKAAAVARAAELTASVPHARLLQVLDKQAEIARAWTNGRATTLVLGAGMTAPGTASGGDMGAGPASAHMGDPVAGLPLTSISELAGGVFNGGAAAAAPSAPRHGQ